MNQDSECDLCQKEIHTDLYQLSSILFWITWNLIIYNIASLIVMQYNFPLGLSDTFEHNL